MKKMPLFFSSEVFLVGLLMGGLFQIGATPKCLIQEKKDTGKAVTCLTCHNAKLPKKGEDASHNDYGKQHQKTDKPCHKKK